jgi:hypothetical protein
VTATTVFNQNGVEIQAGCKNGAVELTLKPQGGQDHSAIEITSFDNTEGGVPRGISLPDTPVNVSISMLPEPASYHDFNGLLAIRTLGGAMTTVQWFAIGSVNSSQGECVGGGTAAF